MSLVEYRRKRDFKKTREPSGDARRDKQGRRFVIQKHAASRLHYDFRLELDGTLKSWAVPKGVPFVKGERRLAVQVEDHPVSYIDFEGIIPKGQYGGGTVMVWDQGEYKSLTSTPAKDLAAGKLHFILDGKKLKGEWYLVRLRDETQWLLIRGKSNMRPVSKKMDDTSALSGKSMKELAAGTTKWESNRSESKSIPATKDRARPAFTVGFIEPMKARLVAAPPPGDWIYEIKLDGFRALAFKQGNEVKLLSRNENDLGTKFPEVVESMAQLEAKEAILDGEIVALDPKGRSSFQLLQARELGQERPPIYYYAFDLLRLGGKDLRSLPLIDRKAQLEKLLKKPPDTLRFSASLEGDATTLLKEAQRLGLEGLIGKRIDSVYEPGKRSGAWIKLKLRHEQEFVIGGYTDPGGGRKHFGALLVGYYANRKLMFSGKVGTGFDEAMLADLHKRLTQLAMPECAFTNLPEKRSGGRSQGITASAMRRCHWTKPILVCQVKFAEWTEDGKLRQPAFLGLRQDKDAKAVVREIPA